MYAPPQNKQRLQKRRQTDDKSTGKKRRKGTTGVGYEVRGKKIAGLESAKREEEAQLKDEEARQEGI